MGIETCFDVSFVARLALREKQIQQSYRPIIAVHKWFARRPGTLFRALILSEFVQRPVQETYYQPHQLIGVSILDPFMGGGTTIIEAHRLGCSVIGLDINPMSYWIVREALEPIDIDAYGKAVERLLETLEENIGHLYKTACAFCGEAADVKSFLWVKIMRCPACGNPMDLFPGYVIAYRGRHPRHVVACRACGSLNELDDLDAPAPCKDCGETLILKGNARRNRATCPSCGASVPYPSSQDGPPAHRMFALEYYCRRCAPRHEGRFFKAADTADLRRYEEAVRLLEAMEAQFIPDEPIPPGDETARLLRWGYRRWRELFNARQLLGLEWSAREIMRITNPRLRRALATNLSDLLRYQNMLCRYDPASLKVLDVFSIHGFPVSLIQAEANLLGIRDNGRVIGSGGWQNIVEKYRQAKAYAAAPFEHELNGRRIYIPGERMGSLEEGEADRRIRLECKDARKLDLPPGSVDAVLTDPPYFGNVQYAELMEFCYVWLRRLAAPDDPVIASHMTVRSPDELTGNRTLARGLEDFTEGLSTVFRKAAMALKPGRPLVFTYHHNEPRSYWAVAVAVLDAGLTCIRTFPCPSEMHGSIHINRTRSSRVDMIFVCRSPDGNPCPDPGGIHFEALLSDLMALERAGLRLREGDVRTVLLGHITRMAIQRLLPGWMPGRPVAEKLAAVEQAFANPGELEEMIRELWKRLKELKDRKARLAMSPRD